MWDLVSAAGWWLFALILLGASARAWLWLFALRWRTWPLWQLPPETHNLGGDPIAPGALFFQPPPGEIGPVLYAESTLSRDAPPATVAWKLLHGVVFAALALTLTLLMVWWGGLFDSLLQWLFYALIGLSAFGTGWVYTSSHVCTYVGTRGVVRFEAYGEGAKVEPRPRDGFLCHAAMDLRQTPLGRAWGDSHLQRGVFLIRNEPEQASASERASLKRDYAKALWESKKDREGKTDTYGLGNLYEPPASYASTVGLGTGFLCVGALGLILVTFKPDWT